MTAEAKSIARALVESIPVANSKSVTAKDCNDGSVPAFQAVAECLQEMGAAGTIHVNVTVRDNDRRVSMLRFTRLR